MYRDEHVVVGPDQENPVLIRLLAAGWLSFRVAAPRLSPETTWGPSPANLVVANRPRGLTRDKCQHDAAYAATCATVIHGDAEYLRLRDDMNDIGLWSEEFEALHQSSLSLVLSTI